MPLMLSIGLLRYMSISSFHVQIKQVRNSPQHCYHFEVVLASSERKEDIVRTERIYESAESAELLWVF